MKANELRRKFIDFFAKNYEHAEIKSSSLIPENDPTVLFTTAGMHPLVPFLMGEAHPSGKRLVDVQKCIRTDDIDEVGDDCHLTFFEMLGNWSLGDYFKEEAIKMSFEFLTDKEKGLGIDVSKLAVSCFAGDDDAPKDMESFEIWQSLGIAKERIAFLGKEENWWGPAGQTGPCGPDTEMFYWTGDNETPEKFDPEDDTWVEIWNDVFMQYYKNADGSFKELKQKNVDTGMGFERVLGILNDKVSPFETELFEEVVAEIKTLSCSIPWSRLKEDLSPEIQKTLTTSLRIIADHLRAATFLLGDENGVTPSNTDQGYILRRLIRRAIRHGKNLEIQGEFARKIAGIVVKNYGEFYTELANNQEKIYEEMMKEEQKFNKTLNKGLSLLHKEMEKIEGKNVLAFKEDFFFEMFATYGFPMEMTIEELKSEGWITDEKVLDELWANFDKHYKKHQELSKAGAEKKFSGGLADNSDDVKKLHTATHLLHTALRQVLGDHVEQKGSNITADRLRFDFTHGEKMTDDQKMEVEKIVNEQIEKALPIKCEEMSVEEAKSRGAIGLFESKYGDKVKVYSVGEGDNLFSMEICGGPHAENTSDLGGFKIKKEQSSSSGVRRIKAIIGV
jgi:alanyl-tRNA synthetase